MLSVPDIAVLGTIALLLFGPEQLPKVLRTVGHVVRDVQNTSQSFIREMERAADDHDVAAAHHDYAAPTYASHEPYDEHLLHETEVYGPHNEPPHTPSVAENGIRPAEPAP